MLDKFFLKYERGGDGGMVKLNPLPPGKTTLRKPSLIRVNHFVDIKNLCKISFIVTTMA